MRGRPGAYEESAAQMPEAPARTVHRAATGGGIADKTGADHDMRPTPASNHTPAGGNGAAVAGGVFLAYPSDSLEPPAARPRDVRQSSSCCRHRLAARRAATAFLRHATGVAEAPSAAA